MPSDKEGSQAWLDRLYDRAAQDVRAFNQIDQAESHINILDDGWDTLDHDLKSALFTSIVIHYARPFTTNENLRGKHCYPVRQFKGVAGFDRKLHDHLCDLRDKLVAHQDGTLLKAQIGRQESTFHDHDVTVPVLFFAVTAAFDGLANKEICGRYRTHIQAACQAVRDRLKLALHDITMAAEKYPGLRYGSKKLPLVEGTSLPDKLQPLRFEQFVADIEIPNSPVPPTSYV